MAHHRTRIFVATQAAQVPPGCRRFLSVDGTVPGAAVTWDHHVSGEPINLDAMPDAVLLDAFDGIATTLADTDALASVVAALWGGKAALPAKARAVLEAASHRCDHLLPHPAHRGRADAQGRALLAFISNALAQRPPEGRSGEFARLCRLVSRRIATGRGFPRGRMPRFTQAVRAMVEEGRLRSRDGVLLVDLRGAPARSLPPDAWYHARPACRVAVIVEDHPGGGLRYTVGRNPVNVASPTDLRGVLAALARKEFSHGAPAQRPDAGVGAENWGGRREVGGSPWNYGSRLDVEEVVGVAVAALRDSSAD